MGANYAEDLKLLTALGKRVEPLEAMLSRALDTLDAVVRYDLAVILELDGDELRVRTAAGKLANDARVRAHRLDLKRFPTIRRALETRRPIAFLEHHHESEEGDPYAPIFGFPPGHSCMIVPLYAGERTLGAMTFDRTICEPYPERVVELAGVFGELLSQAIVYARQSELLARHRQILLEATRAHPDGHARGLDVVAQLERARSPEMQHVLRQARLVADTHVPVLVCGETGVGKELLARAIHAWSPRRDEAFVAVNCAAIPDALVESELFGHVKGAFTGASASRAGRFVTANGGTLFLDELGEMPLAAQSKLLRVLQEGTFEPVGSDRPVRVDVRVVAATRVDLQDAVRRGTFRDDLYFRLAVFPLTLSPLRARRADIQPLAEGCLERLAAATGRGPWTLDRTALAALERAEWPGNVRELVNVLERATILVPEGPLGPEVLFPEGPARRPRVPATLETLVDIERRHIKDVLRHCGGRIYGEGGAARVLGMKPTTLQSRMRKLGIARVEASEA